MLFKVYDDNEIKVDDQLTWHELVKCCYGSAIQQVSYELIDEYKLFDQTIAEWDVRSKSGWILIPIDRKNQLIEIIVTDKFQRS